MGNPGSNRDAETGTWKLVSGMKIYETSRISIHVSDPLTSWKIKINELLASALWELSFCPELVLAHRCYTLTGSSTDTRTARSKWKIGMMKGGWGFPVHQETGLKCRRLEKRFTAFYFKQAQSQVVQRAGGLFELAEENAGIFQVISLERRADLLRQQRGMSTGRGEESTKNQGNMWPI